MIEQGNYSKEESRTGKRKTKSIKRDKEGTIQYC